MGLAGGWIMTSPVCRPAIERQGGWRNLIMPAVALGGTLRSLLRLTRSSLLEDACRSEYVKLARLKGLCRLTLCRGPCLQERLIPGALTTGRRQLGVMINAAVSDEVIVLGQGSAAALRGGLPGDFPLVQGVRSWRPGS